MKRLLLLVLLSTAALRAEDFATSWKTLSSYRLTSAVKGAIALLLTIKSGEETWKNSQKLAADFNEQNSKQQLKDRIDKIASHSATTFGMGYVTYKLAWDYLKPYAQHALAIK